jgi:predicted secreted protein with PEFG-CTERM motif
MKRYTALVAGLVAIFASAMILPIQSASAATVNVDIVPGASTKTTNAYSPNPVEVNVGDTVVWTNKDTQPHTATSGTDSTADGKFGGTVENPASELILANASYEFTFTEAGEYPYFCSLHPAMVGTVMVSGDGGNGDGNGGATEGNEVEAEIEGSTFTVTATPESPSLLEATVMPEEKMVGIEFEESGDVELTLPTALISGISAVTTSGGDDVAFQAGTSNATHATISFALPEGETYVDVTGATVAPEFGVIAALVLAASLVAAIGFARVKGSSLGFGRF